MSKRQDPKTKNKIDPVILVAVITVIGTVAAALLASPVLLALIQKTPSPPIVTIPANNTVVPSDSPLPPVSTSQTGIGKTPLPSITLSNNSTALSSDELLLIRTIPGAGGGTSALSADGQIAAIAYEGGKIKLWSTSEDNLIRTLNTGNTVLSIAFSQDNQFLAAGLSSSTVKVWRLSDGLELPTLEGLSSGVYSVAFSPDGQTVAAGATPSIMLWRVSDGKMLYSIDGLTSRIYSLAFSPDGMMLASGMYYSSSKLWQVTDGNLVREVPTGGLGIVAFSPQNGETLAITGNGTKVYLGRVRDGALLHELPGHTHVVESLAFSSDGQTLVSVSNDIEVRRWQVS